MDKRQKFELNREGVGASWTACAQMQKGAGKTPEEAVAELYIKLNANKN